MSPTVHRGATLFRMGNIEASRRAVSELKALDLTPQHLLCRHATGDWGGMTYMDEIRNYGAVRQRKEIVSVYQYLHQSFARPLTFTITTNETRTHTMIRVSKEP
jgi:hypothetical protein